MGPFLFNGPRFLLGAAALTPWVAGQHRFPTRTEWLSGLLVGALLFGGVSLQQVGLKFTTAGKAGSITSLYVILVPLLLVVVWRQRPLWTARHASLAATVGLCLLRACENYFHHTFGAPKSEG